MARKAKADKASVSGNGTIHDDQAEVPGLGHNGDKEHDQKAEFFGWCNRWIVAKETLEQIEEDAKTALGKKAVRDFRLRQKLRTEKGEKAVKEQIERALEIARWLGMPIGAQSELFPIVDRTPLADRAYAAGELAGLNGERRDPPHSPGVEAYDRWLTGYADGNERLARSGFKPMPPSGEAAAEPDLRPPFLQTGGAAA